jgi:hypothetical protein
MKRYWLAFIAILVLLTSCAGAASDNYAMEESIAMGAPAAAPMEMEVYADSAAMDTSARSASSSVEPAQQERLVIKNADLSITVDDPIKSMDAIAYLAESLGGHVVSSNTYQTYANNGLRIPEGSITIRIPSEKLTEALDRIKTDAVEVENETVSGEDVTDQYVNLQSRLKAKKAAEAKLLEIMEQARTTEDTLNVYAQLQVIQSDIEVLQGQINYYERSAAMSSISVRVIATEKSQPIEIGGWELGQTASAAVQDLINYMQGFVQFMIRFIIFTLPVLITLALPFYLIFIALRALLRRSRAKKATKAEAKLQE